MIVSNWFSGDNNDLLKRIQHDCYNEILYHIYKKAWYRYNEARKLLKVETKLYNRIKDKHQFDHRVLQRAHDKIAAYYRYQFKYKENNQLPLPFNGENYEEDYEEILEKAWYEFYFDELKYLTQDNSIVRAILIAVGYQNNEKGYKAEDRLLKLLDCKFSSEFVEACIEYKQQKLM